jgi:hypothetical protein
MKAKRATRGEAKMPYRSLCVVLVAAVAGCGDGLPTQPELTPLNLLSTAPAEHGKVKFSGTVDVVWNGGQGSGPTAGADRTSQGQIVAFPGVPAGNPGPGNFTYRVLSPDGTVHREIGVKLTWAGLEDQSIHPGEIRFVGVVVSDTKPCGGSQHGAGECSHDDGGCSHDDGSTHDDGGCSHDDGTTHDDGGCSHDDGTTHDDGGCSHDDGSGGHGEPGGPGGPGGHVSGSDCRIGQIVIGWALDGATPAVMGDRISWKWFAPDAQKVLDIQEAIASGSDIPWPCKLCEKEILGGNLTLHSGRL